MIECLSRIISVGYALPQKEVKTKDIERELGLKERLGIPYGLLERLTGCQAHREAPPETNASDLATEASRQALDRAQLSARDIDLVIFCACCHDVPEPATANIVQEKLGADRAHVFDIKNACNAFLNGIDIADSLIACGKATTALIATGEVTSKFVDKNIKKRDDLQLKGAGLTLGDGGGAVILQKNDTAEHGLVSTRFKSDGRYWRLAVVGEGGTMYPRDPSRGYFWSDSEKIITLAFEKIPDVMRQVMKDAGWGPNDVDLVIPHQVTVKIIKDIMDDVTIPFERAIITVDRFGNTAASTIPIAMATAIETKRLRSGMRVLLVGGAAGFSVGVIGMIW